MFPIAELIALGGFQELLLEVVRVMPRPNCTSATNMAESTTFWANRPAGDCCKGTHHHRRPAQLRRRARGYSRLNVGAAKREGAQHLAPFPALPASCQKVYAGTVKRRPPTALSGYVLKTLRKGGDFILYRAWRPSHARAMSMVLGGSVARLGGCHGADWPRARGLCCGCP
jgi:hypothetical protein